MDSTGNNMGAAGGAGRGQAAGPGPLVVRLGPGDVPAVAALERRCFSSPWDEKLYTAALGQSFFHLWGVSLSGQLAGYVSVYHLGEEVEIINIAVAPHRRRQGLGGLLLDYVCAQARVLGAERIILEVRKSNAPAIALYAGRGFAPVGVRPGYYPDTGEDGLIYECNLCKS